MVLQRMLFYSQVLQWPSYTLGFSRLSFRVDDHLQALVQLLLFRQTGALQIQENDIVRMAPILYILNYSINFELFHYNFIVESFLFFHHF